MRADLLKRCELLVQNTIAIKSAFKWENSYTYPLCAEMFTEKNAHADAGRMKYCMDVLKNNTGVFSNFRGTIKLAIVSKLAIMRNMEQKLQDMLAVYKGLNKYFRKSEYLALTASIIVETTDPLQYDEIIYRTHEIYTEMKQEHPFLTSDEDTVFAALLAASKLEAAHIENEMEACYAILKPQFFYGNAVQSLSHVLAMGEDSAEVKCSKFMALLENLENRGCKYSKGYELPALGPFAILNADMDAVAGEIAEVNLYLKDKSGFGNMSIGTKQRLMHAGVLVLNDVVSYVTAQSQTAAQTAAINSVIALVVAQQAAVCAAVTACAAASVNSSNG